MENKVIQYQGNNITFEVDTNNVMVNATEMSINFNKRPTEWLRTQSSKEFLEELSKVRKCTLDELVVITKGGANARTMFHKDVAIEFSRWLSPKFSIWCNDRIQELLNHGITATPQTIDNILGNPDLIIQLATKLKQERLEKSLLQDAINKQAPRIKYLKQIIATDDNIDIGQAAKILELPFGRNKLFKKLREDGVFFKSRNEPKQTYIDRGFFKLKEKVIETSFGDKTYTKVLVTQKGLMGLYKLFKLEKTERKLTSIT